MWVWPRCRGWGVGMAQVQGAGLSMSVGVAQVQGAGCRGHRRQGCILSSQFRGHARFSSPGHSLGQPAPAEADGRPAPWRGGGAWRPGSDPAGALLPSPAPLLLRLHHPLGRGAWDPGNGAPLTGWLQSGLARSTEPRLATSLKPWAPVVCPASWAVPCCSAQGPPRVWGALCFPSSGFWDAPTHRLHAGPPSEAGGPCPSPTGAPFPAGQSSGPAPTCGPQASSLLAGGEGATLLMPHPQSAPGATPTSRRRPPGQPWEQSPLGVSASLLVLVACRHHRNPCSGSHRHNESLPALGDAGQASGPLRWHWVGGAGPGATEFLGRSWGRTPRSAEGTSPVRLWREKATLGLDF